MGQGVHEIGGAVERVDVPAGAVARRVGVVLFRDDGVARKGGADAFDDDGLGPAVDVGDEIDRALVLHAAAHADRFADERAGLQREFAGEAGAFGHGALLSRVS